MQEEVNILINMDAENERLAQHKQKSKLLYEKISSGQMTINEARKEFGRPPIEDGDVLITKV